MPVTHTQNRFDALLQRHDLPALQRQAVTTLQVNLGRLCNQACRHCHVDAGPHRTELMDDRVIDRLLQLIAASPAIATVDITGGAPELNPRFRRFVAGVREAGRQVMVRCNLTVIHEPGMSDLPDFYAQNQAKIVASLPCYTADNVDRQRGGGVFELSIKSLRQLNGVGYGAAQNGERSTAGHGKAPLRLDLVFNPLGPSLPPAQAALEADYRERLQDDFGIVFDRLLTLANMPIHRFADDLRRHNELAQYHELLEASFNPGAVDGVMCREMINVDWNGRLADCDFHQMLNLPTNTAHKTIFDIESFGTLDSSLITTASHCLGCTAGQGSSCGGALTDGSA
ncbi:MAG: radical SAM/Cys-rich protein [Pseudohongiellaceae bacterium]